MALTGFGLTPSDGLKNTSSFPTNPPSETAARKQVQDVIDQVVADGNTLVTELSNTTGASEIGCTGAHSKIQDFITATEVAGSGTTPGAGVVTNAMLNTANKTGLLSDLVASITGSARNSFALAINFGMGLLGDLSTLGTTAKDTVVNAINELTSRVNTINGIVSNIGSLSSLYTTAKDTLVNAINEITNRDIGKVSYFAMSTAPSGYFKANGAEISRTTYANLFSKIGTTYGTGNGSTTFNLPDSRGEFIRGWDDSRGIDSGRALGSAQSQDIQPHNHPVPPFSWDVSGSSFQRMLLSQSGSSNAFLSTSNAGVTETRPRNISLLACIKY